MRRILAVFDGFTLLLIGAVLLASIAPASGVWAQAVDLFADIAVVLLFFLHGARLQREAVVAGLLHWRLHLMVLAASFLLFPALGLAMRPLADAVAPHATFGAGLLFLCCLPSTVQSSIAFVSMARGNVAAAVCAASASNLLGILITPMLVGFLLATHGSLSGDAVVTLATQLLLPFLLGQLLRTWIGGWVARNKGWLGPVDRTAVILMVYSAFGAAVLGGLWTRTSLSELLILLLLCALLLAVILGLTALAAEALGFSVEDRITIIFCGSKKSLVTGVPMAKVLFPAAIAGTMVLPLMIFHQLQLLVCAVLARRFAQRTDQD